MNRAASIRLLFALAATCAPALLVAGCDDGAEEGGGKFDLRANVRRFAGPTPFVTRFRARAENARGAVLYRWRFDDGTASEEEDPVHTFPRAGYYTVILDGRDEAGNADRLTFLLGVWTRADWALARSAAPWGFWPPPKIAERTKRAGRAQERRTDARHAAIVTQWRMRARRQAP